MKKLILLIALALPALLTAQQRDWANYGRYAEANAQLTTPPAVVFMGNSITDGWDNAHPEFFTANNFACRGIGGQVTAQMLCRFRADVINLHPQAVVILAGTNDLAQNNGPIATQHIVENIAGGELSREVIVPLLPSTTLLFEGVTFTVPKRGEKLELLEFSRKSARIYRAEQLKNLEIKNPERYTERLMNAVQKELRLDRQPRHIECFDNSNLQGAHPVASCVVFRDGKPSRKEYRHFNIKTVVGADDFASMREIVFRRYSRLIAEGAELPDLIIVDGGKGQLSSAYAVLCELGIEKQVPIVGLAKRIEEIFFPGDPMPYYLSRTGEPLKVVCHIRDEAHRFGITFHRQKRSKGFIHSELENIEGVGPKTIELLLRHFRTVEKIRTAPAEELSALIGPAKAARLLVHFGRQ